MMTWTYVGGGAVAVVTAENVDQAIIQLRTRLIEKGFEAEEIVLRRDSLVPMVTNSRATRILHDMREDD